MPLRQCLCGGPFAGVPVWATLWVSLATPRDVVLRLVLGVLLGGSALWLTYRALPAVEAPAPAPSASSRPAEVRLDAVQSLQVGSLLRTYRVHRPENAADGAPLWLVLHGSGGTGADMQAMHGGAFDRLADREGIVLAYPDGFGQHWNDCRPSADYSANLQDIDDVGFLRALVDTLHADLRIDRQRIAVIGISNGGQMVFRLAFEAPELASIHVAMLANLPAPGNDDCRHLGHPTSMLLINGSEDPINPSGGGLANLAGNTSRGAVLSSKQSAETWARWAGHADEPAIHRPRERSQDDETSVEVWEWQKSGAPPVTWISLVGGGHSVPTTAPLPEWPAAIASAVRATYGRQSTEFETAEIIFDFSSSRRLRLL